MASASSALPVRNWRRRSAVNWPERHPISAREGDHHRWSQSAAGTSLRPAFENQRRINAAEREVVGLNKFGLNGARSAHDVIQITASRIGLDQVDGRREALFVHHLQRHPGLQRTAGAKRMTKVAF